VFTWGHMLHVEGVGQLGKESQHAAFRGTDGATLDTAARMGPVITRELQKALGEAGMNAECHLTCNDLRHQYVPRVRARWGCR